MNRKQDKARARAQHRADYAAHREKRLAYQRAYHLTHKANQRAYRAAHRKEALAHQRAYYQPGLDSLRQFQHEWHLDLYQPRLLDGQV